MATWEWLAVLSAAFAVVAATWQRARAAAAWVRGLVVVQRRMNYPCARVLVGYLHATGRPARSGDVAYNSTWSHVRPLGRGHRVWFQMLADSPRAFWLGRRPVWFAPAGGDDHKEPGGAHFRFSFVRGTLDFERLLLAAAEWESDGAAASKESRFCVVPHHGARFDPSTFAGENTARTAAPPSPISDSSPDWHRPAGGNRIIGWSVDDIAPGVPSAALAALSLRTADRLAAAHADDSAAQFQERCYRHAYAVRMRRAG